MTVPWKVLTSQRKPNRVPCLPLLNRSIKVARCLQSPLGFPGKNCFVVTVRCEVSYRGLYRRSRRVHSKIQVKSRSTVLIALVETS